MVTTGIVVTVNDDVIRNEVALERARNERVDDERADNAARHRRLGPGSIFASSHGAVPLFTMNGRGLCATDLHASALRDSLVRAP